MGAATGVTVTAVSSAMLATAPPGHLLAESANHLAGPTEHGLTASPEADSGQSDRDDVVSRSTNRREALSEAESSLTPEGRGDGARKLKRLADEEPRDIAKKLLNNFGFDQSEFACLDQLYVSESNWRVNADNPSSSAYGIPQALPGSKMASAGDDWATNPVTQIKWGLTYIKDRYGTPCAAWSFKQSNNWY